MHRKLAELLGEGIVRATGVPSIDKDLYVRILETMRVAPSLRFYEKIPYVMHVCGDYSQPQQFSMTYLIRNPRKSSLERLAKMYESALLELSFPDFLKKSPFSNKKLVRMMAESPQDLSILGQVKTYNLQYDKGLMIITRPVLFIPGAKDWQSVYEWQEYNKIFELEKKGLFFSTTKRFKPKGVVLGY